MNTLRYKPEYSKQVIDLLKDAPNLVRLPSKIFLDIGKLFESEPDDEKLGKLLNKTYTVMAVEGEKLVGLAGMDKEGNIGLFYVDNNDKAQKLLLNALDRRAAKTETPQLFVQPFETARDIFVNNGYEPMDEGDDFNLIKKTELKEKSPKSVLLPDGAKNITLDATKAITVEGKHSIFPFLFFGISCFFMFLLTVLSVTKYRNAFAENDRNYIIVFVVITLLFAVALAILIGYFVLRAKLKKEILSMRITNGVITAFSTSVTRYRSGAVNIRKTGMPAYTRVFITYVFYDENMVKRTERFSHRYNLSGPYFYEGQELVIAYSQDKSYILSKYTIADPQKDREEEPETHSVETVNTEKLSAYVPIRAAKIYYGHALSYLCAFVVMFVFFLLFGIMSAKYMERPLLGEIFGKLLFGVPFFVVLGGLAIYSVSIPLAAKSKYKKLLASSDVKCTKGRIVHADKAFKSDNKMRFYCKFDDGKEKRSVSVPYRTASKLLKSGKSSVLVVFDSTDAIVLVKRGVYPDIFSYAYYRN